MVNVYWKYQAVRLSCAFTVDNVATDPTTITLNVKTPDGTTTAYTFALGQVTRASAGNYYKDVSTTLEGRYFYQWIGTGTCESADEGEFGITSQIG